MRGGARARIDGDRTVVLERPEVLRGSTDVGLFAALPTPLFLVDGNNLLWRAAHGRPAPFAASDGRDLTPVFRFFHLLRRALGTYGLFAECVVCFDGADAWAGRLEIDPTYKANRRYEDADLWFMGWLPEIRAALEGNGIAHVEHADDEADDVIATLASRAGGRPVRISSTDRDYFQLLSPTVTALNLKHRPAIVRPEDVLERYGVTPEQWCDLRALAGDPSDGIPGLRGIGPKRAAQILRDGRTLDDLRAAGALPAPVEARWTDVCRWRRLVTLRTDAQVHHAPTGAPTPRLPAPAAICRGLGLIP